MQPLAHHTTRSSMCEPANNNTVNVADVPAKLNNLSQAAVDMGNWMLLYGTYRIGMPRVRARCFTGQQYLCTDRH